MLGHTSTLRVALFLGWWSLGWGRVQLPRRHSDLCHLTGPGRQPVSAVSATLEHNALPLGRLRTWSQRWRWSSGSVSKINASSTEIADRRSQIVDLNWASCSCRANGSPEFKAGRTVNKCEEWEFSTLAFIYYSEHLATIKYMFMQIFVNSSEI